MSVSIIDQNYALRLPTLQNNMPPPKLMVKENSFHIPNPNLSSYSKSIIPGPQMCYLRVKQNLKLEGFRICQGIWQIVSLYLVLGNLKWYYDQIFIP